MNFTPFGGHFPASIPIHQFAAKFAHDGSAALQPQMMGSGTVVFTANDGVRYLRTTDHGNASAAAAHFGNQAALSMPVNMGKYMRPGDMTSHQQATQQMAMINPNAAKYHMTTMPIHHFHPAAANVVAVPYSQAMVVQQVPVSSSAPVAISCQTPTSSSGGMAAVHVTTANTHSIGVPPNIVQEPSPALLTHHHQSTPPSSHPPTVHLQIPNPQTPVHESIQQQQTNQASTTPVHTQQSTPPTSQQSNVQQQTLPSPQTSNVSVQSVQTSSPASHASSINLQTNMQDSSAQNAETRPIQALVLDKQYEIIEMQPQELCAAMLRENAAAIAEAEKVIQASKGVSTKDDFHDNEKVDSDSKMVNDFDNVRSYSQQIPTPWQSIATPGSAVAEYLSRLPSSTLPLTLHHFLKFSADNIKKEPGATGGKKKTKKKKPKEKKPRPKPGEIRLTTALDGSTLYCCPECHMAYPERELLEQHMMGHKLERRFVCNICGAGLKRKEHLDRHKQGHNPERPYVCTICLKGFKRNEHLTRHFIIHSGEKNHVCPECGKAFYRKDHLRKHTQTHIAKRVKAELQQQGVSIGSVGQVIPAGTVMPVASVTPMASMASIASMASMVSVGTMTPVTAVALMPDGATVPIIT